MGATPVSRSRAASGEDTDKNKSVIGSLYDLLYELLKESPSWVRVGAILVISSLVGLYVLRTLGFINPSDASSRAVQAYSFESGKQVDGPGNSQMADASLHLAEEDAHIRWHHEHPEDNPPMKMIFKITDGNYLGYQFYEKSDHCVFVLRMENGVTTSRWLRDPLSGRAATAGVPHDTQALNRSPADVSEIGRLLDALVPSAAAATLASPAHAGSQLQSVQTGCFQGTHPGQFTWWWGTPEDQCWTPMHRQWKDGCQHYQRYNKCTNSWDERIIWVTCSAGPHS
jgi:hypothetical protein